MCVVGRVITYANIQAKTVSREEDPSMLSLRVDTGSVVLQDLSDVVDHIVDDLGGEDFVDLSCDATGEPWFGTSKTFGVLLEVVFD